jgi:hypothetical protein
MTDDLGDVCNAEEVMREELVDPELRSVHGIV